MRVRDPCGRTSGNRGTHWAGCDRAHAWRRKALERRLPSCEVPAASLPTSPSILADRLSLPCGEESRSSPRRVDCALRRRLPTRVKGPSGVDPPVRLRRRTLACPVLPLRALAPASTGLATDCDVSLGFHFHCWSWDPMKPRGIFLRLCPPAKQIDHEWFSLPGEPQPRLLPVVRPRPTYHLSMI